MSTIIPVEPGKLDSWGVPLTWRSPDDAEPVIGRAFARPVGIAGRAPTSPRIRLRQKAGFGGQERGEVTDLVRRSIQPIAIML
jgi:hypothetical protein